MTTPDHPFANLPPRFPQEDADAFMALFHALDRNYVDAMALCLILEMHAETPQHPWISASYRELSRRSQGGFVMQAVQKSFDRLVQHGCLEVANLEFAGRRVRANLARARCLARQAPPPAPLNSPAILWGMALGSCWTDCVVLTHLVTLQAHRKPIRESNEGIARPLGLDDRSVIRARHRLTMAGILRPGKKRGQWSGWCLDTPNLQALLAQEAEAWITAGSPEEPWMPGLRIAVSSGSTPDETAFDDSALRTL